MILTLTEEQREALTLTVSDDLHRMRTSERVYGQEAQRATTPYAVTMCEREAQHFGWRGEQLAAVLALLQEENT